VRERKSGRSLCRKENRGGGYGEDGLLPPLNRTKKGVDREDGRWRGKERRRPRPWGRPVGGAKRRGGRGQLILLLTLVGHGLWREIDGGRRSATEMARAVAVGGSEGREKGRCGLGVRQGRRESVLLAREGGAWPGSSTRSSCLPAAMAVRPTCSNGGRRDVSGSDAVNATRRTATWWQASWQAQVVSRGGRWLAVVSSSQMMARAG
jgi:hypothetical protein